MEDESIPVGKALLVSFINAHLSNLQSLVQCVFIKWATHSQYSEIEKSVVLVCIHISCFVPRGNFTIKDAI